MQRPFLIVDSTGPLLFDGLVAVTWFVRMTTNITAPRVINIAPGQLYTFIFEQNGVGGHTMSWPGNCMNAAALDPQPNATTTQTFVGDIGGKMYASIPPTWSQL
jgi:Tfp pilus tip-associated adhesin PilY1